MLKEIKIDRKIRLALLMFGAGLRAPLSLYRLRGYFDSFLYSDESDILNSGFALHLLCRAEALTANTQVIIDSSKSISEGVNEGIKMIADYQTVCFLPDSDPKIKYRKCYLRNEIISVNNTLKSVENIVNSRLDAALKRYDLILSAYSSGVKRRRKYRHTKEELRLETLYEDRCLRLCVFCASKEIDTFVSKFIKCER